MLVGRAIPGADAHGRATPPMASGCHRGLFMIPPRTMRCIRARHAHVDHRLAILSGEHHVLISRCQRTETASPGMAAHDAPSPETRGSHRSLRFSAALRWHHGTPEPGAATSQSPPWTGTGALVTGTCRCWCRTAPQAITGLLAHSDLAVPCRAGGGRRSRCGVGCRRGRRRRGRRRG